jgi:hypothetical protein
MQRFFVRVFAADGAGKKALPVTFDAAYSALAELPRLFIEPDGSFVWTSPPGEAAWQVDGTLVDGGETLYYCELKGMCPPESLDQMLHCISSNAELTIEDVAQGTTFSKAEFRRLTSPPDAPAAAPRRPA